MEPDKLEYHWDKNRAEDIRVADGLVGEDSQDIEAAGRLEAVHHSPLAAILDIEDQRTSVKEHTSAGQAVAMLRVVERALVVELVLGIQAVGHIE